MHLQLFCMWSNGKVYTSLHLPKSWLKPGDVSTYLLHYTDTSHQPTAYLYLCFSTSYLKSPNCFHLQELVPGKLLLVTHYSDSYFTCSQVGVNTRNINDIFALQRICVETPEKWQILRLCMIRTSDFDINIHHKM